MLGEQLDAKVKKYIQALRNAGTPIGSSIVMAAGEGIVISKDYWKHDPLSLCSHCLPNHQRPVRRDLQVSALRG